MNFNLIIIGIFALFSFYGCGVKARPAIPPEKAINSYIESYTKTPVEQVTPPAQATKK